MCYQKYQLEDVTQTMESSWNTQFRLSNNFAMAVGIISVTQYSDTQRLKNGTVFCADASVTSKVKITELFKKALVTQRQKANR